MYVCACINKLLRHYTFLLVSHGKVSQVKFDLYCIYVHMYINMYVRVFLYPQIALVKWTESVGLSLIDRDLSSMTTEGPGGERDQYEILQLFPFTSERKRMGIIVRVR